MRFKDLHQNERVEFRGKLVTVARLKDWSDGSRTIVFSNGEVHTRKANVLVSSI